MNSKVEILQTKLFRPSLPSDFVSRTQLLSILEEHHGIPFCLVSAPAGYGKSTTLSSWLEQSGHKSVWLSLDETDDNLISFLNYFIVGIRTEFPQFSEDLLDIINAKEPPSVNVIAKNIQNELDILNDDLIFILDDFHFIKDKEIHKLLELILQHPPRGFHLVISTRMDPPMRLSRLRASAHMNELRAKNLKFNEIEVERFLSSINIFLNSEQNKILQSEVEGWPAGLRLATLSMKNANTTKSVLEKLPNDNKYIAEYLLNEILIKLNEDEREFLFVSALFDSFNDSLLVSVVSQGKSKIQKSLHELYKRNYFLISLDENREWYRFHHLFKKLLENEAIKVLTQKELELIYRKAAKWFVANGFLEEGIKFYLKVDEVANAIKAFSLLREQIMNASQFLRLHKILQLFSIEQINHDLTLKVTKAWDLIFEGKTLEMFEDLENIKVLLQKTDKNDKSYKNIYGEVASLDSWKLYNLDANFEATIKVTEEAFNNLNPDNHYPHGYAWIFYGGALQCLNRTNEALNGIYKHLDLENENLLNYYLFIILNYIYLLEADFDNLYLHSQQYIEKAQSANNKEGIVNAKYFLGFYYYQTNDIENAQRILKEAYDEKYYVLGIHQFGIIAALALTYVITGDSKSAIKLTKELSDHAVEKGNPYFTLLRKSLDAEINYRLGEFAEAKKWATNCGDLPLFPFTNFFVFQIPKIKIFIYSELKELQDEAHIILEQIEEFLRKSNNKLYLAKILALKSLLKNDLGKKDSAYKSLEESLNIAEPSNLIRTFVDLGSKMSKLLIEYSSQKKEVKFIGIILKAFNSHQNKSNLINKEELEINSINGWKDHISPREFDVLKLLTLKYRNKEIADKLFISPSTVKRHTINIYQKFNVNSRNEAVQKAKELGIIN